MGSVPLLVFVDPKRADDYDEITREAIGELSEWVEENFKENEVFTILGL